jgi:transposase InsO family protein
MEPVSVPDNPTAYYMASTFMLDKQDKELAFPMSTKLIAKYQKREKDLETKRLSKPEHYSTSIIEEVQVVLYDEKIYVPKDLRNQVVSWYHEYLCHPGMNRTEQTIRQNFTWPGLRTTVEAHCKTCHKCQLNKKQRKKYGHLPAKEAEYEPWTTVCVDLVGPYTVRTPTGIHKLRAMTMIDPATGWFEIKDIPNKEAGTVMDTFHNTWLCRYPRPTHIGFDNGSEFKAQFKDMCENYNLRTHPTASYNPQANGIIERVHQVLGNSLRTFELEKEDLSEIDPWGYFLSSAAWAIRSTFHTTLRATPGQLIYGRDMLLNTQFKANWANIRKQKQDIINKNNRKENSTRILHLYSVGDQVLLTRPGIRPKLSTPRTGPHSVLRVHENGTVKIRRGHIEETVNIRRLTPYVEPTVMEANALYRMSP